MAETSKIEWTDATWNPITGCTLVPEGCRHCYAARLAATRLRDHPSRKGLARINAAGEAKFTGEVRFNEQWIDQPLRWRKPRRIFVCAHGDLFHENVPDEWIDRVLSVMALSPKHTFQVLTKRPERAKSYMTAMLGNEGRCLAVIEASRKSGALIGDMPFLRDRLVSLPLSNVWLGTSVEDQATADARIPHLLATPAAVRFVSAEPLLGAVRLDCLDHLTEDEYGKFYAYLDGLTGRVTIGDFADKELDSGHQLDPGLDWVIVGGESGPKARPMQHDWARSLRDQCQAAGVAFFMKQMAHRAPIPDDLLVREFP